MQKNCLLTLMLCIYSVISLAQQNCGSELNIEELQKSDPKRYEQIMQFNKFVEQYS